jgi:hypothetical protein
VARSESSLPPLTLSQGARVSWKDDGFYNGNAAAVSSRSILEGSVLEDAPLHDDDRQSGGIDQGAWGAVWISPGWISSGSLVSVAIVSILGKLAPKRRVDFRAPLWIE